MWSAMEKTKNDLSPYVRLEKLHAVPNNADTETQETPSFDPLNSVILISIDTAPPPQ